MRCIQWSTADLGTRRLILVSELDALLIEACVQWGTSPGYPYQFPVIFQNHIRRLRERPAYASEALTLAG